LLARTGSKQPDAIMAANDLMAIGALRALKARGLGVPQDVSVVGFDDIGADLADPPLTTVRQPLREMGARAAEVVYTQILGKSVAAEHMFAPELIVRGSCRTESKQRPRCPQGMRSSIGAFIDRAYPSPDGALAAVWDELLGRHQGAQRTRHRVKLLLRLGELFKLAECRERALVEALMRPRAHAHRELLQVLASSKTWSEVRARAAAPLSLLGIDSLTVVALKNPPVYEGQAQVLLDFDSAGAAPIGADGAWLPARRLLVERTRRATGSLWVLRALEEEGPLGFVLLRGAVLDDAIVTKLCGALARRVGQLDL
jgi:hypothetical protein